MQCLDFFYNADIHSSDMELSSFLPHDVAHLTLEFSFSTLCQSYLSAIIKILSGEVLGIIFKY